MNAQWLKIEVKTSVEEGEPVKTVMGVTGAVVQKDTQIMAMKGPHAQVSVCIHDSFPSPFLTVC